MRHNCLSALMSFGTSAQREVVDDFFGMSQLPFGFDVGWYCSTCETRRGRAAKSHNCLSALMSVGTSVRAESDDYYTGPVTIAFRL